MWVGTIIWDDISADTELFTQEENAWKFVAAYIYNKVKDDGRRREYSPLFEENKYEDYVHAWSDSDEGINSDFDFTVMWLQIDKGVEDTINQAMPAPKESSNDLPKEHGFVTLGIEFKIADLVNPKTIPAFLKVIDDTTNQWTLEGIDVLATTMSAAWFDINGEEYEVDPKVVNTVFADIGDWEYNK